MTRQRGSGGDGGGQGGAGLTEHRDNGRDHNGGDHNGGGDNGGDLGRWDVVVVGAGTAGAACAAFLAEAGFRVICLERRPLAEAGARWVNGVPQAAFARAGIALPEGPEHRGGPAPFHVVAAESMRMPAVREAAAPAGSDGVAGAACPRSAAPLPGASPLSGAVTSLTIAEHDVISVDMRLLVARLQARGRRAGVTFHDGVSVHGWQGERLGTSAGPVAARWFVDASGLIGPHLLDQPHVPRAELCTAAQQVHEIADRDGARRFLEAFGARPGEAIAFLGVAGGFSVLTVDVDPELDSVGVLTGSLPALGYASGKEILEHFVAGHAWVGATRFGGAGAIPLRRPHDRLASERVALIGDAGCQVFPAHGSGIGSGLIAARILADTLAAGRPLRDYEVAWQREHGALMASFNVMRRWSQSLDLAAVAKLMAFGLLDASLMKAGLNQELPRVSLRALLRLGPGMRRTLREAPALAHNLAAAAVRSKLVHTLYARYPRDVRDVPAWSRAIDRLIES